MTQLTLHHTQKDDLKVNIERLLIGGWAGRDRDAIEHHIKELEELGVSRPSTIPCYYQVADIVNEVKKCYNEYLKRG